MGTAVKRRACARKSNLAVSTPISYANFETKTSKWQLKHLWKSLQGNTETKRSTWDFELKYIQVGISYWFGILFWVPRKERQFSINNLKARHQLITTFAHAQTFGHCSLPSLYHQPPALFLSTLQKHVASYLALVIWSSLMTTDN